MSNVIIDRDKIDILANAISDKSGVPVTMTLDEMVEAVDGIETGGGGITPTGNIDITSAGVTDVTNYATATVAEAVPYMGKDYGYYTLNGNRRWHVRGALTIDSGDENPAGYIDDGTYYGSYTDFNAIAKNTTVTPTESTQTIGGANYMMEGAVTVNAIPSNYVGSGITQRSSSDLTASGATVTVPSGYYSAQASKAVASGTEGTPTATKGTVSNHTVTVTPSVTNTAGYISGGTKTGTAVSVSASELVSGTYTVDSSGTKDVTNYASVSIPSGSLVQLSISGETPTITVDSDGLITAQTANKSGTTSVVTPTGGGYIEGNSSTPYYIWGKTSTEQLSTQAATTITPTTSSQIAVAAGKYTTGAVTVAAMPTGTAGTPTATKGSVSNHQVSVTPSVTNTTGYITGSTKTGTAVTVTAAELASGNKAITQNGTDIDVVGYSTVSVAVPDDEFIITLSYNSSTDIWTPDCTFAEAYAAYNGGKTIVFSASKDDGTGYIISLPCTGQYNTNSSGFTYAVEDYFNDWSGNRGYVEKSYRFNSNGVEHLSNIPYYELSDADPDYSGASPSDVASGKIFYNSDGYQVGTNSGGGSSSLSVGTATATPTSSSTILFENLVDQPTSYVVISTNDISTSATPNVATVAYDGTGVLGQGITTTSNAQVSYLGNGPFMPSFNAGDLQIQASGAQFVTSNTYKLIYTYGGSASNISTADVQVGSGATSITFTGLEDEPAYFSCIFKSNFSTSSGYQRVIAVVNDGTDTYGLEMDSQAHYSSAHWSYSYNNGSLTITSSGTNAGGYFHQPGYYQLTYAYDDGSSGNYQSKTVTPTTSQQIVEADSGYDALKRVTVNAMPSGSATAPASISGTAASVSTGTNTLTLTKTVSVTPTVSAGYVSAGTAGNSSVSLTANITTKAAATITPGTSNQTIASGTYLTGTQTIAGDADLVGGNILSTANIFGVQGTVVVQNYYTGSSAPSSSTGSNGDLYLQS